MGDLAQAPDETVEAADITEPILADRVGETGQVPDEATEPMDVTDPNLTTGLGAATTEATEDVGDLGAATTEATEDVGDLGVATGGCGTPCRSGIRTAKFFTCSAVH